MQNNITANSCQIVQVVLHQDDHLHFSTETMETGAPWCNVSVAKLLSLAAALPHWNQAIAAPVPGQEL